MKIIKGIGPVLCGVVNDRAIKGEVIGVAKTKLDGVESVDREAKNND